MRRGFDVPESLVFVRETSRLYRRPMELETLVELMEGRGLTIVPLFSSEQKLDSALERNDILTAASWPRSTPKRSRSFSKRVKMAKAARRAEGAHNGGQRTLGHYADRTAVVPDEAEAIQDAARRIIGGASLYSIAEDWNARSVATSQGAAWRTSNLARTLRRPSLAGLQTDGAPGNWPTILTVDEHRLLCARLDGSGGAKQARPSKRRGVLSGLVVCDACGKRLVYSDGRYRCDRGRNGGCGRTRVAQGRALEAYVLDLAAEAYEQRKRDPKPIVSEEERAALAELREVEERLVDIAEAYGAGELDRRAYGVARQVAEQRRDEMMRDLADTASPAGEARELTDDALVEWQRGADLEPADIERLQSPLRALLGCVRVAPGEKFARGFDPERVRVGQNA